MQRGGGGHDASAIVPAAMMRQLTIRDRVTLTVGYPVEAEGVGADRSDAVREESRPVGSVQRVCRILAPCRCAWRATRQNARSSGRAQGCLRAIGRLTRTTNLDGVVPRTSCLHAARIRRFRASRASASPTSSTRVMATCTADHVGCRRGRPRNVIDAGAEIMQVCAEAGGSLSGEHGIGMERRTDALIFSRQDVAQCRGSKRRSILVGCASGKIFPTAGDVGAVRPSGRAVGCSVTPQRSRSMVCRGERSPRTAEDLAAG